MFSFKDIKQLIAIAYPDKDYQSYSVHSFNLTGATTETTSDGVISNSFIEAAPCGALTEKQRSLIEKYGKPGMVFTLDEITMVELGKPGTPYNPGEKIFISVPAILFTIKE